MSNMITFKSWLERHDVLDDDEAFVNEDDIYDLMKSLHNMMKDEKWEVVNHLDKSNNPHFWAKPKDYAGPGVKIYEALGSMVFVIKKSDEDDMTVGETKKIPIKEFVDDLVEEEIEKQILDMKKKIRDESPVGPDGKKPELKPLPKHKEEEIKNAIERRDMLPKTIKMAFEHVQGFLHSLARRREEFLAKKALADAQNDIDQGGSHQSDKNNVIDLGMNTDGHRKFQIGDRIITVPMLSDYDKEDAMNIGRS